MKKEKIDWEKLKEKYKKHEEKVFKEEHPFQHRMQERISKAKFAPTRITYRSIAKKNPRATIKLAKPNFLGRVGV